MSNKSRYHGLWLMLPAVLVGLYIAVFEPQFHPTPATGTTTTTQRSTAETAVRSANSGAIAGDEVAATQAAVDADLNGNDQVDTDREFINHAFPVLSSWNLQELKPLLADQTIETSSDAELAQVMSVLEERLGALKYFDTPQPVLKPEESSAPGSDGLQLYQFMAYYEAGAAEINLMLQKERNDNSLYSFNINVPNDEI